MSMSLSPVLLRSAMSMTPSPAFLPNDLITEILTFLPVKSILRFSCVSHSFETLISDPTFVKLHLTRSKSRNQQFILIANHTMYYEGHSPYGSDAEWELEYSVIPYPLDRILDNPSFTLDIDPHFNLYDKDCTFVVGNCDGLICLCGRSDKPDEDDIIMYFFRLWNPATRKMSEKFGYFSEIMLSKFSFGRDNSTGTFKVVAHCIGNDKLDSIVSVFNFGDNVWRNIEGFPTSHMHFDYHEISHCCLPDGVLFNDTLNWLAVHNNIPFDKFHHPNDIPIEQFVIISLDLGSETYTQYMLPQGFDEVPQERPTVFVLDRCLCFSYFSRQTDIVIWKMKEFGVEESWTQFIKIGYHNLQLDYDFRLHVNIRFWPLLLSKDGDTVILRSSHHEGEPFIYNLRDDRVERACVTVPKTIIDDKIENNVCWGLASGYVESLISIC